MKDWRCTRRSPKGTFSKNRTSRWSRICIGGNCTGLLGELRAPVGGNATGWGMGGCTNRLNVVIGAGGTASFVAGGISRSPELYCCGLSANGEFIGCVGWYVISSAVYRVSIEIGADATLAAGRDLKEPLEEEYEASVICAGDELLCTWTVFAPAGSVTVEPGATGSQALA